MIRVFFVGGLVAGAVACSMQSGNVGGVTNTAAETTTSTTSPVESLSGSASTEISKTCVHAEGTSRAAQACWRWRCDGDPNKAAAWDGSAATCNAGELDPAAADRALRRINVHRFIADVAPFIEEPSWSAAAQQCALIADANGKLSHTPPQSWNCWSQTGADASAGSLVANRSVAASIAAYVQDPGNEETMVHRRWLLDETLASVGFGSTDAYSCVVVDGRKIGPATVKPSPSTTRGWSAWPPDGPVPFDVFTDEQLDTAGWTVQSITEDLDDADVAVTLNGASLPVTQTHLTPLEGSRSAIKFVPVGWTTKAGQHYAVHVTTAAAIDFTVTPVDCDLL